MWAREYQNSPFWFHIRFPHSLLSLSKKHISLCQLLTIEPSVAEFKSTGCDSCGPWSGVSQRAGQTFLPALWLTMGTITSATARHSDDERKRRSGGLFSESVNYLAAYMAHSAFPPSLLLSSSSPFSHFLFSLWLHRLTLRNIIWFEIQHFPLCHVVGSAAHALCRSLISIHSLLKCSSIHLRRMLRLALKVERILLIQFNSIQFILINTKWVQTKKRNLLYRKRLQTVSHFLLLWLGDSQYAHTYPVPPLQITYQAKAFFFCSDFLWNVTSVLSEQDALYWHTPQYAFRNWKPVTDFCVKTGFLPKFDNFVFNLAHKHYHAIEMFFFKEIDQT